MLTWKSRISLGPHIEVVKMSKVSSDESENVDRDGWEGSQCMPQTRLRRRRVRHPHPQDQRKRRRLERFESGGVAVGEVRYLR